MLHALHLYHSPRRVEHFFLDTGEKIEHFGTCLQYVLISGSNGRLDGADVERSRYRTESGASQRKRVGSYAKRRLTGLHRMHYRSTSKDTSLSHVRRLCTRTRSSLSVDRKVHRCRKFDGFLLFLGIDSILCYLYGTMPGRLWFMSGVNEG